MYFKPEVVEDFNMTVKSYIANKKLSPNYTKLDEFKESILKARKNGITYKKIASLLNKIHSNKNIDFAINDQVVKRYCQVVLGVSKRSRWKPK